jgi:DNA-binding MarR family transcriptional regulator
MPRKPVPLLERFERFLPEILDENSCWEWQGVRLKGGYGKIMENGRTKRTLLAHRVAWEAYNAEPIPPGMCVCHSCDNRACVNPAHLFIGTHVDNMQDMISKGRKFITAGELSSCAKLTNQDVLEIRELGSQGFRQVDIAKRFGVRRASVSVILNGSTWKHLPVRPHTHAPKPRGSDHHGSRLTPEQVLEIREAAKTGETRRSIADRYGVTPENVSSIVLRKTWTHV